MFRCFTVLALLVMVAGCSSSGNAGVGRVLTTVAVTPATASVQTAGGQQFTVAALDQTGAPFAAADLTITWAVENPAGGTIVSSGPFTAQFTAGTVGVYDNLVTATVTHIGTTEILEGMADLTVTQ